MVLSKNMHHIDSYFKKYAVMRAHFETPKKEFSALISEKIGGTLDTQSITLQQGTVRLHAHSVVKAECFLNKESILEKINKQQPQHNINTIQWGEAHTPLCYA